jgi:ribosomal protein L37AE/L43A
MAWYKLSPTKIKCPKCKSKTEEIYYHFGVIRNKCLKCNYIFKKYAYSKI